MALHDYVNNSSAEVGFAPVVVTDNTATLTGIIDVANCQGVTFHIATGTLADADATFAVTLEHGDDSGLADTAAPGATERTGDLPDFTFADDDSVLSIGYIGPKRYVRLTVTPTGNGGNAPLACTVVKNGLRKMS